MKSDLQPVPAAAAADKGKADSSRPAAGGLSYRRQANKSCAAATLSASSAGMNGEESSNRRDVNMVAAIQDHLSCTKSTAVADLMGNKEEKVALPCELDHMYANCGGGGVGGNNPRSPQEENHQVEQLRELLLLHLDLIQQQEEQLRDKDKQLSALKQEKEMLKQKVDRMERRIVVLKQKEKETADRLEDLNLSNENKVGSYFPSSVQQDKNKTIGDRRSVKRKSSTDSISHAKRKGSSISNNVDDKDELDKDKKDDKLPDSQERLQGEQLNSSKTEILRTDIQYHVNCENSTQSSNCTTKEEEVIVPSWRLHPVTSCYQLEGTENLEDEVFLKRHQKLEIDERRRKRWDIQRIREQRLSEKLKRGRSGNKDESSSQDDEVLQSFFPNPEEAQFVEVCDTVPVCAFGFPVPNFQPCEFSLPWCLINGDKRGRHDRQRNLSNSTKKLRTNDGKQGS